MSDWIPAPQIENALIILLDIPDLPEAYETYPLKTWLSQIAGTEAFSRYLFHESPDAGEVFEEVEVDLASRFALLAQLPGSPLSVMFSGFRRIFSRAETKKAILIAGNVEKFSPNDLESAFNMLNSNDLLLIQNSEASALLLGMNKFYQEIFQLTTAGVADLRKILEQYAAEKSLSLCVKSHK